MESRRRSLVKALSWRALAFLITSGVAYVLTGNELFAASIGLADSVIKILVYYLHERAWDKVPRGRGAPAPSPSPRAPVS